MSAGPYKSLTGQWTGVYDYPDGIGDAVPFRARLTDVAGALVGEIVEPNTFSSAAVRELFARLTGRRTGTSVTFAKIYDRLPDAGHVVHYSGDANAKLSVITGRWVVRGLHAPWSGPFVMNRVDEAAKAEEISIEADVSGE